mmetsp:Transcript_10001/g.42006  ORF Transcript_10001/g.42006 Transcript_10001/m.42006 type:complete len:226 (+) Transcript_10001:1362-2039(+)
MSLQTPRHTHSLPSSFSLRSSSFPVMRVYISSTSRTVVSKCVVASYPLLMKHPSFVPSSTGTSTSETWMNFSSMRPRSSNPGWISRCGFAVSTVVLTNARYFPLAHTLCAHEHPNTYMSVRRPVCFWGKMICTECASPQPGMGCDKMHSARTTWPTRLVFPGKYDGSPTTNLARAVSPSEETPMALPVSGSNSTVASGLLSMYVPPYTALSRAKPCGSSPRPYRG